ncbi:MAG: hypothetical protein WAK51_12565, partial [Opitutaceae bacterium]
AKAKIDGFIKESAVRAKVAKVPDSEFRELLAKIGACGNHASKRVASIRTPWQNYFRFRLITRKQLGIKGDEWPC